MKLWEHQTRNNWQKNNLSSVRTKLWFAETLLAIKINKTIVTMNKPVYVGLLILHLSKIAQYKYRYNYAKPDYRGKAKLCFDTDSLILKVKSEDIYGDPVKNIETRCDISNYEVVRQLPIRKKTKNWSDHCFHELSGLTINKLVALGTKMYSNLTNDCYFYETIKGS